ncbi:MAG: Oligopeptide transport ATP-binding protein OppF, partial [uncultured Blastococcus sp.]
DQPGCRRGDGRAGRSARPTLRVPLPPPLPDRPAGASRARDLPHHRTRHRPPARRGVPLRAQQRRRRRRRRRAGAAGSGL